MPKTSDLTVITDQGALAKGDSFAILDADVSVLKRLELEELFGVRPCLPAKIFSVEDRTTNIYFKNAFSGAHGMLRFDVACTKGSQYRDRWSFTPTVSDIGTHAITVGAYFGSLLVAQWSGTIVCKGASVGSSAARNVLLIGDSTANDDPVIAELVNLFGYNRTAPTDGGGADVMDITPIGTVTAYSNYDSDGNLRAQAHEARAGWTWNMYRTDPSSPFVNSGSFDFSNYLTVNSIGMTIDDWVLMCLGVNDIFSATDANIAAVITNLKSYIDEMVADIQSALTGVRIGIGMNNWAADDEYAWGVNYGCGQNRYQYQRNWANWIEEVNDYYGGREDEDLYVIPVGCQIDPVNCASTADVAKNQYVTDTEARGANAIHPNSYGAYQYADALYQFLKCQET